MNKLLFIIGVLFTLQACSDNKEYNLEKFYKDKNSPAAVLMGSTYAGVVSTFSSEADCIHAKQRVESADKKIGYTNSIFKCTEK